MYYRRREISKLETLLQWRRNVFLQAPDGEYVLVSATRYFVTLHYFNGSLRGDPTRTERLPVPDGLFDGNGWNLAQLNHLIQSRQPMNQQSYVALYCKPLRASIRNLTNEELRVFVTLTTYADEQGVCYPGVRLLGDDTGLSATEVSTALEGLKGKGFINYLRYNQVDPLTRKIMPNVFGLSLSILALKTDSGIQAYMFEFLNQISPSQVAQPESLTRIKELESKTRISNHHHQPTPENAQAREIAPSGAGKNPGMENSGKDKGEKPDLPIPAVKPQPTNSENDVPPPDTGDLKPYAVPLPEIDAEAHANELQYSVTGLQLAKARQLVAVYGMEQCATALGLLAKQPFGSVKNKPGWLIDKLRKSALLPVDGEDEAPGKAYITGKYSGFIEH